MAARSAQFLAVLVISSPRLLAEEQGCTVGPDSPSTTTCTRGAMCGKNPCDRATNASELRTDARLAHLSRSLVHRSRNARVEELPESN